MLPIHTILHPTDFSKASEFALQMASALARDYGARLVVLHVAQVPTMIYSEGIIPPDPEMFYQQEKDQLQRLQIKSANVRAERRFEKGDPDTTILDVAQEIKADMIVMGTHGRRGLTRVLMGSVAEQVVRRATCPVLTVRIPVPERVLTTKPVEQPAALNLENLPT
ncbi:MAG TPA: universal stress protein [Gemmataceae bacterium]|nr:universal stress protein [Gemmataceae bacterium]